ncbi:MAG: hypothetical protein WAM04_21650 [Candidatus Sulfotelmatobacter sp.]
MKLRFADENRPSKTLWLVAAIGALLIAASLVIAAVVAWQFYSIRSATKWFVWSQRYKREVLAQSGGTAGELKHVEWDGWGFPGAGDTIVYLVYDPTDSLSAAAKGHQPGKFIGIPCTVFLVSRLESEWYTVQFYTQEEWGRRNALDCGSGSAG